MDRHQEMTVFCAVVEEHSFSLAARRLGLSAPAVTRAVASLESRIGASLLIRGAGPVRVTDAGKRFHDEARLILTDVDLADEVAAGRTAELKGMVTLSSPLLFGEQILLPLLLDWLRQHSNVRVRANFIDHFPDLHEEGIDVAILAGRPPDHGLVLTPAGSIKRLLCASPKYLAMHKVPTSPSDLTGHSIVFSSADSKSPDWTFQSGEERVTVRISPTVWVSTNTCAIDLACDGLGITRVMHYQVLDKIQSGELIPIMEEHSAPPIPLSIAHLDGRDASPKVSNLVGYLKHHLELDPRF